MIERALAALRSPRAAQEALRAGAPEGESEAWLLLLGAALYSNPAAVPEDLRRRFPALAPLPVEPPAGGFGQGRLAPALARGLAGPVSVLAVHNIRDGQGDEIVRCAPLLQSLLDWNPELTVTIATQRAYLYSHPRIAAIPIGNCARALDRRFDAVIDFFDPDIAEVAYDPALEPKVREHVSRHRPFLFIASAKGYNHFLYECVEVEGRDWSPELGLGKPRLPNNYDATHRLCAEAGWPIRSGEEPPRSPWVLAGVPRAEADAWWSELTAANRDARPVALLQPFGGAEPLKGYREAGGVAAEASRLVAEGYFVAILPNGAAWGNAAVAQSAFERMDPDVRERVVVGPDPAAGAGPSPGGLDYADHVMRMTLYAIARAALVVTVEGWMMHAAWCLGRPYRTLMLPYSHSPEWHPLLRSATQGMFPVAGESDPIDGTEPPTPSQPRKWILIWALREAGRLAGARSWPVLQWAVSSPDRHIRKAATEGLIASGADAGMLRPLLDDASHEVRALAAAALPGNEDDARVHVMIGAEPRDWTPVYALGEAARPALERAATGDDPVIRREALAALRLLDFRRSHRQPARWWRPAPRDARPSILVLTPVKDAALFAENYRDRLLDLSYPHDRISVGLLESDSADDTFAAFAAVVPRLRRELHDARIWKRDFGYRIPPGLPRWSEPVQMQRRSVLARSRNHLLSRALDDHEWVLWLDADVVEYPQDILDTLLATRKDIAQPHCVMEPGGPSFDLNAWRDRGRLHLHDLRAEGQLVHLHAVGGTMLLVRADLHRDGLLFPTVPYGAGDPRVPEGPGLLETEGLGILALHMGHQPWGLPHVEIRHRRW